jgi:hypothetical protein
MLQRVLIAIARQRAAAAGRRRTDSPWTPPAGTWTAARAAEQRGIGILMITHDLGSPADLDRIHVTRRAVRSSHPRGQQTLATPPRVPQAAAAIPCSAHGQTPANRPDHDRSRHE